MILDCKSSLENTYSSLPQLELNKEPIQLQQGNYILISPVIINNKKTYLGKKENKFF